MSEPLPDDAEFSELHSDDELAALAEVMPSVPDSLEMTEQASSWPREQIDPTGETPAHTIAPPRIGAALRASAAGGIRNGGTVIRPATGAVVRWSPIEPIADEYEAVQALAAKGYSCLGVIGNVAHLRGSGGHTPWCSEGFAGRACRYGKVYAIDLTAPNMSGLERWLITQLRAGRYGWVYYLNINGNQYTRRDSFRGTYSSPDHHLHLSGLAGHESDSSSILRDWDAQRTTGGDDMAQVPQAQWERARKQLDALSDAINGGTGAAYKTSVLREDHGFQIEEIERRLTTYVDERLSSLEKKLDALIAATTPKP